MNGFLKKINEIKYVFFIKDDELREKYNKIWDKVSCSIKKGFDVEPVCNEKYLKTETKSYEGKIMIIEYQEKVLTNND